ncbi:MAG: DUF3575 domain-containing protein [Bacteroidota bacterium]|nr:DUF3575 domain-containing protein [Bacteroidota bacterium]
MRKIICLVVFVMVGFASSAQNVNVEKPEVNRFRFSVIQFINSSLQVEYERMVGENNSFIISPMIKYRDNDTEEQFAVGVDFQYRFYVYHKDLAKHSKNIFFAPYSFYKHYSLEEEVWDYYHGDDHWYNESSTFDVVGGGVVFGLQYVFADRISVDAYVGGGLRKTIGYNGESDYFMEAGNSGIVPKVGLNVGFSF